jgi:hypothetical protein
MDQNRLQITLLVLVFMRVRENNFDFFPKNNFFLKKEACTTTDDYDIIGPVDAELNQNQQGKVSGDTLVYVDEAALEMGQKKPRKNVLRISVLNSLFRLEILLLKLCVILRNFLDKASNSKVVFKRPLQQGNSKNKKLRNRARNAKKNGKNRKKGFTKNKNSELVPVDRYCEIFTFCDLFNCMISENDA